MFQLCSGLGRSDGYLLCSRSFHRIDLPIGEGLPGPGVGGELGVISGHSSVGNDLGAKLLVTVMTCRSQQRNARWQRAHACQTERLSFNELLQISPGSLSYASLTTTDSFIRPWHVCHT